MISGYYCNECSTGICGLNCLKTGNLLATPEQSGRHEKHISQRENKGVNGVFSNTGEQFYRLGGQQIGISGFCEVENDGEVNAYLDFRTSVGEIQLSGVPVGNSTFGKAVLLNHPNNAHWFPFSGFGLNSGFCSNCGIRIF